MHRSFFILSLIAPFFTLLFSWHEASAARVTKVKGQQILIDNEGMEVSPNERYFIVIDGKKKGLVLITQSKGGKSLGKLTKGTAKVDATVEPTGKKAASAPTESADVESDPSMKKSRKKKGESSGSAPGLYVGAIVGYAMDSQTVKNSAGTSIAMAGSGYSAKVYGDMPLSGRFGAIGRSGIEQLNLTGSGYTTSIMYLTADALLRYSFSDGGFVPYVAGGLGVHFPLSKSSDILDTPRISSTTVFFGNFGINYAMGENTQLTMLAEYGFFPPSNDVTTSFITARIGMGWRF